MQPSRKRRLPRVERTAHHVEIQDETSQLWAVSYADFLMVLLCFFILFFSFGNKEKDSIIQRISDVNEKALGARTATAAAGIGGGKGTGTGSGDTLGDRMLASEEKLKVQPIPLQGLFNGLNVVGTVEGDRLLLLLPDNLYAAGAVTLTKKKEQVLQEVLLRLKPFAEQIQITFVGHADALQFHGKRAVVLDNFDLSSLRATRALQYAVRQGFDGSQLSAMGTGENKRKTRTLSLLIRAKGENL